MEGGDDVALFDQPIDLLGARRFMELGEVGDLFPEEGLIQGNPTGFFATVPFHFPVPADRLFACLYHNVIVQFVH